jgi:hypothetical protein
MHHWFVDTTDYIYEAHEQFPFAERILPGFWPWNVRTARPHYPPEYLAEQIRRATALGPAFWIYTEGLTRGGDPRETLDPNALETHDVTAEAFLDVFREAPSPQDR